MKTETILGKEVLRVNTPDGACRLHSRGIEVRCAFAHEPCLIDEKHACIGTSDFFIRPNQLNDYLAIKLVS